MAQETPTQPAKKPVSKTEFVRALPPDMPAAEVIKKAAEAGVTISIGHVHTIRWIAKRAGKSTSKPTKAKVSKRAKKPLPPSKKTRSSKADFVRAQPKTMSAAEVVKKGKAAGMKFNLQYVYRVRSVAKGAAKMSKVTKKPAAPKKTKKAPKADFVRSMPAAMTAREVVAAAAKRGLKITEPYVYIVRGKSKGRASKASKPVVRKVIAKKATRVKKAVVKVAITKKPIAGKTGPEMVFVKSALDLGLGNAKELLAALEESVAALLEGMGS